MKLTRYLITRVTTLKPPLTLPDNPWKLLMLLNRQQAAFFLVAFIAWTWDSFDFFTVVLNVTEIGKTFNLSNADVTWGMTITLMLRSVGAIIFGIAGDRFGRKWPFIINIVLYGSLEILSGFSTSFTQFIVYRALFGIAMGGIYGNCAATALEDAPLRARGILSGILQQGYACGFLLASAFNLLITPNQPYGWKALFWFGGCPPFLIALWRMYLPETQSFRKKKQINKTQQEPTDHNPMSSNSTSKPIEQELPVIVNVENHSQAVVPVESTEVVPSYPTSGKTVHKSSCHIRNICSKFYSEFIEPVFVRHWLVFLYMVLLMTGFNFLSHGSQDMYPTFLKSSLGFSNELASITTIVSAFGALCGSTLVGYFSTFIGRRLSMLVLLVVGASLIPAYVLPRDRNIIFGAFLEQFCVQGVWGVVPIYLLELSPAEHRSFVIGTAYQLGNLVASGVSTMEAKLGQYLLKKPTRYSLDEQDSHDYGRIIGFFVAFIYLYIFIVVLLGPEPSRKSDHEMITKLSEFQKEEKSTETASSTHKTEKF